MRTQQFVYWKTLLQHPLRATNRSGGHRGIWSTKLRQDNNCTRNRHSPRPRNISDAHNPIMLAPGSKHCRTLYIDQADIYVVHITFCAESHSALCRRCSCCLSGAQGSSLNHKVLVRRIHPAAQVQSNLQTAQQVFSIGTHIGGQCNFLYNPNKISLYHPNSQIQCMSIPRDLNTYIPKPQSCVQN